jgi:hypothetical protein
MENNVRFGDRAAVSMASVAWLELFVVLLHHVFSNRKQTIMRNEGSAGRKGAQCQV